jgi:hypothetical protein
LIIILVGIPFVSITLIALALLYMLGGSDLVGYSLAKLLTWDGLRRVLIAFGGLSLLTWLRHAAWYENEPPPMWFRPSIWLNIVEGAVLVGVIVLGIWAYSRCAPPPLPPPR